MQAKTLTLHASLTTEVALKGLTVSRFLARLSRRLMGELIVY